MSFSIVVRETLNSDIYETELVLSAPVEAAIAARVAAARKTDEQGVSVPLFADLPDLIFQELIRGVIRSALADKDTPEITAARKAVEDAKKASEALFESALPTSPKNRKKTK